MGTALIMCLFHDTHYVQVEICNYMYNFSLENERIVENSQILCSYPERPRENQIGKIFFDFVSLNPPRRLLSLQPRTANRTLKGGMKYRKSVHVQLYIEGQVSWVEKFFSIFW